MTIVLPDMYYTDEHEWLKVEENNIATVGITDFAQDQLGDIVFIEMPQEDEEYAQMDEVGVIESVKTVSNIYLPVSGRIVEVNEAVIDDPGLVNSSPYDEGWLLKIEMEEPAELEDLKSAEEYEEIVSEEE